MQHNTNTHAIYSKQIRIKMRGKGLIHLMFSSAFVFASDCLIDQYGDKDGERMPTENKNEAKSCRSNHATFRIVNFYFREPLNFTFILTGA